MNKILLVVDLQKEFADVLNNSNEYNKVIDYIRRNANSYDEVLSTIFKNDNINYHKNLNWDDCTNTTTASLEYYPINNHHHDILFKEGYGDKDGRIVDIIKKYNAENTEIHIIGCDLDACIMAICFQLWDAEITNFKVLTEFCYSTAKDFTKEDIIKIMKRNFGECIIE